MQRPNKSESTKSYIFNTYGLEILQSFKEWEKAKIKLSHINNDKTFLTNCRNQSMLPDGIKVSSSFNDTSECDQRILNLASFKLLRSKLQQKRSEKSHFLNEWKKHGNILKHHLNGSDYGTSISMP